ncbi:hypothetical protein BDZ94DRAFT_1301750 [Collybia nuda]|uniref:DUF6534 domain-containing protein n=1 Tax=Collybia nuda TaxID=64659 RepID=A0A9P5XVM5_9AGAR|nr:hypothetical protein BDZ94DRAFT_1301750 [Collybia nuda]
MAIQPTLDNTWGAALIGLVASSIIYGITTLQAYLYFTLYPNDSIQFKSLAGSVWLIDTVSLVLVCNGVYGYLVRDMAKPANRLMVNRSFDVDPALMGLLALLTHGYLGLRVWKVCRRNIWFGLLLGTLSLSAFALSITASVLSFRFEFWSQRNELKWIGLAGTILVVILDGIIAIVLCVYLLMQKVEGKGTRRIINRVLIFTINTGLASSLMSIVNIVTFFALPNTLIFLGTNFIFTKVYANAILANLNARKSLRGRGYLEQGTLTLNLSALHTNDQHLLVLNEPEGAISAPINLSNLNRTEETINELENFQDANQTNCKC